VRRAWTNGCNVDLIGKAADLTYEYAHKGTDRAALQTILDTKPTKAIVENPSVVVLGQGALLEADGAAVLAAAMQISEASQSKLLILHTAAGRVGAMDVDATNADGMKAVEAAEVVYNMGADEIEIDAGPFVIYQGSHGDRGAHRADIILPGAAYTEENALFVNTEGRPQLAMRASFAPGEAKENWAILRALSAEMGAQQPWDSLAGLRTAMVAAVPHLAKVDDVIENEMMPTKVGKLGKATFKSAVRDFYLTNPIARASQLMGELSGNAKKRAEAPIAAE
jgi:NADH-quinone oxidoreductase subunit G